MRGFWGSGIAAALLLALGACAPLNNETGNAPNTDTANLAVPAEFDTAEMFAYWSRFNLSDPDDVKSVRLGEPFWDFYTITPPAFSWLFCGEYNPRNEFGGYDGLTRQLFVADKRDGRWIVVLALDETRGVYREHCFPFERGQG